MNQQSFMFKESPKGSRYKLNSKLKIKKLVSPHPEKKHQTFETTQTFNKSAEKPNIPLA